MARIILTLADIDDIKAYLHSKTFPTDLTGNKLAYFKRKVSDYIVRDNKLYFCEENITWKVLADDDKVAQDAIFESLHLPDHTGMKAM